MERLRIPHDGRDVLEEDPWLGKVGDVADQGTDAVEGWHGRILAKKQPPVPWGGWDRRPWDRPKPRTRALCSNAGRRGQGKRARRSAEKTQGVPGLGRDPHLEM